eukprot:2559217-Amphidinium_carterae.1
MESHARYSKRLVGRPFTAKARDDEIARAQMKAVKEWTEAGTHHIPTDIVKIADRTVELTEQPASPEEIPSLNAVPLPSEASVERAWARAVRVSSSHGLNAACIEATRREGGQGVAKQILLAKASRQANKAVLCQMTAAFQLHEDDLQHRAVCSCRGGTGGCTQPEAHRKLCVMVLLTEQDSKP